MRPIEERFWEKVDTADASGCWPWLASGVRDYGRFAMGGVRAGTRRRMDLAHRVAWELCYGGIPAGLCVLHRCDNKPCVRPDHLFLGTYQDNSDDMCRKGRSNHRSVRGEEHPGVKLTRADVLAIRERLNDGEGAASIARSYPVTPESISNIKLRKVWGWL